MPEWVPAVQYLEPNHFSQFKNLSVPVDFDGTSANRKPPVRPTIWVVPGLSEPILAQAAHSNKLEENPEWALILGLGYNPSQRRTLIYKHLGKLLEQMRSITGGDAAKAKELSEMLYMRTHAGNRHMLCCRTSIALKI